MPSSPKLSQSLAFVVSEALFAKELFDLLGNLETAIPGSGKEIVRLQSDDKTKKVREYLKSKSKKSSTTRKAFATT
jgi:hypothetical protein